MPTQAMQALSDFQGDHLSVPMFAGGASIWDGVTDATAALTAALAARSGGGTIYIPGGTYKISHPIPWYGGTRILGDKFNQTIIQAAPGFSGNALFSPIGPDFVYAEMSDLALQNPHDQVLWVVNAPTLTSYVHVIHRRLSIKGLNGWTLTALGSGFIGATRNCLWEDVLLWSQDYDQSAAWNAGTAYAAGDIRNYGIPAKPYQAIDANTGQQPDVSPTHWKPLENCYTDVAYQINQGDLNVWRRCQVAGTARGIHTTVASSIGTGSQVVTPVNIKNIQVGSVLNVINADGTNFEQVTVTAQAGATFTATFASSKTGPGIRIDGYIPLPFSTTVTSNISNSPNQVVAPASMTGITAGTRMWIANADGSNAELVQASAATGSTFTISLLNGAKTGPGITVTGPVMDPFIEIRSGSQNQFYDLEPSPNGFNPNKPRMLAVSELNLVIDGYFNEEIKVNSTAGSEYGLFLFECEAFQFVGHFRPDPYRRLFVSRSHGVIEQMSPGDFGGVNDFLDQFLAFDLTNTKSSVLLRQLYVERNTSVRTLTWADRGLIIDRVTVAFEVLGHGQESSVPASNQFGDRNTQNLLVNPSFEAGLYGFLCNDGGATISFPASEVNVGNMCKVILGSSGGKLLEQQIAIAVTSSNMNRPLTFSCLVKMTATVANPATSQSHVIAGITGISGSPAPTNTIRANDGWCRFVQTFVPGAAGNVFVGLTVNCDAADSGWTLYTDDWCVSVGSVGGVDSSRFGSVTLNGNTVTSTSNGNPPTYGTWQVGDICLDATGVFPGWRCVTAGTPGTWEDFLTCRQLTAQVTSAQDVAGATPTILFQTIGGGAVSATDVQYFMVRAANHTDWSMFSYDGTTFRILLKYVYNAGSPHFLFNVSTDDGSNTFQFNGNTKITGNLAVTGTAPGGPPTGAAGGQLSGTYPNPGLADPINTATAYKVAGTQVVGARGASLTAASGAVAGTAGGTYTATEQAIINNLVTLANNLRTRLLDLESRLSSAVGHGLIT